MNDEQHVLELTIFMVGCDHQEALAKRDSILLDLKKIYGIRKLGDMGLAVSLEYRKPEFEWTVPRALSQIQHGEWASARTSSALKFLEEHWRMEFNADK